MSATLEAMSDVTQLLNAIDAGDSGAGRQLLPRVYDELRKLAAGHMGASGWPIRPNRSGGALP
jgi:hypothetical protein